MDGQSRGGCADYVRGSDICDRPGSGMDRDMSGASGSARTKPIFKLGLETLHVYLCIIQRVPCCIIAYARQTAKPSRAEPCIIPHHSKSSPAPTPPRRRRCFLASRCLCFHSLVNPNLSLSQISLIALSSPLLQNPCPAACSCCSRSVGKNMGMEGSGSKTILLLDDWARGSRGAISSSIRWLGLAMGARGTSRSAISRSGLRKASRETASHYVSVVRGSRERRTGRRGRRVKERFEGVGLGSKGWIRVG